jgi:hypothetical protein
MHRVMRIRLKGNPSLGKKLRKRTDGPEDGRRFYPNVERDGMKMAKTVPEG